MQHLRYQASHSAPLHLPIHGSLTATSPDLLMLRDLASKVGLHLLCTVNSWQHAAYVLSSPQMQLMRACMLQTWWLRGSLSSSSFACRLAT